MSNDYIIPDKEVAISDSTSIKSNIDSELSSLENGDIVTCQYLLEEIKKLSNKIDNINITLLDNIFNNEIKINRNYISIMGIGQDIETIHSDYTALEARVTALEKKS